MGGGVLIIEHNSLPQLLSQIYPEFKWDSQLFSQQESDIWSTQSIANYLIEYLKNQSPTEISNVNHIVKKINKTNYLLSRLQFTFPEFNWAKISAIGRKSQYLLKEFIERLFKNSQDFVLLEEYKHPDISNLELDYFLPNFKLGFEYQVKYVWEVFVEIIGTTTL